MMYNTQCIISVYLLYSADDPVLMKIREERGYSYVDTCHICPEKMPNYHEKIASFYKEHIHYDEEIRYCMEGSGYFDCRDEDDRWIRIAVKAGDLLILPEGIYHRFTCDSHNYILAMVGDGGLAIACCYVGCF